MSYILSRLREPSTYAGAAAIAAAFGLSVSAEWVQAVSALGAAVAGVAAVVLKEGVSPPSASRGGRRSSLPLFLPPNWHRPLCAASRMKRLVLGQVHRC